MPTPLPSDQSSSSRKTFGNRFFQRAGKLADKWEQYLSVYDSELAPYLARGTPVRLLEIGVQNGGSLELWSEFLPPGSEVVGIDCDNKVGSLTFNNPDISIFVQDATNADAMRPLLGDSLFDIILDDGSHICSEVIATFRLYFDYLTPGGKFLIEDLHTSYYPSHGGGYRDPVASIEWLKTLVDVLNLDHVQPHEHIPEQERLSMQRLNAQIGRVSFYDSIAVIEKLPVEKTRPYRRVFGGVAADVLPLEDWLFKVSPVSLEPILFAHPTARRVETVLVKELARRQATIDQLRAALDMREREREAAGAAAAAREAALAAEIETLHRSLAGPTHEQTVDDVTELCARVLAGAES